MVLICLERSKVDLSRFVDKMILVKITFVNCKLKLLIAMHMIRCQTFFITLGAKTITSFITILIKMNKH